MKNIATALVKAQKEFGPALKSSTNPHFKSKYADLAACVEAVIDGLNNNGIALIQPLHESENGVTVETMFVHESGEMLSAGKLHVPAAKQDPQGYGSALTYARRYSLMAACGIAPEDDDGNSAKAPKPKQDKPRDLPANVAVNPTSEVANAYASHAHPDRLAELDELALYLIDCHENGKEMDAIRIWYEPTTFKENEERAYVWNNLKQHSKLRSTITANRPNKQ